MKTNTTSDSNNSVINLQSKSFKEKTPLLEVTNLKKYFQIERGFFHRLFSKKQEFVHAIDDISFSVKRGEIFCLVGESGCGKTTTANVLVGLEKPTTGKFLWNGEKISDNELKPRKEDVKSQIIFQDPYSSLSPRMKLGDAVLHPLTIHDKITDTNTKKKLRNSTFAEMSMFFGSLLSFYFILLAFLVEGSEAPTLQDSINNLAFIPLNLLQIIGFIFVDPLQFLNRTISTILTLPFDLLITAIQEILNVIIPIDYVGTSLLMAFLLFLIPLLIYFYHSWIQKQKIADSTILEIFSEIGLTPPLQYYAKFPHEVSGGERQRVSIARAIILNPKLLIADEPTSMLDVSLRAGILDTLKVLQLKHNLSILFITHDLATARHFGDRIGVMYVGKIVEMGDVEGIFKKPCHPYTTALIDAIPTPIPGDKTYELPKGEVPDAINPPSGCRFHPRCPYADLSICSKEEPELKEHLSNHWVACHFPLSSK